MLPTAFFFIGNLVQLHDVFKFILFLCVVLVVFSFHFLKATCSSINRLSWCEWGIIPPD